MSIWNKSSAPELSASSAAPQAGARSSAGPITLSALLDLGKHRIASLAAMSAAAGYLLAAQRLDWGILAATIGTFLLAAAAGAINQIQEIDVDARMKRTSGRALPTGQLSLAGAWLFAALMAGAGAAVLAVWGNATALILGGMAMASYNLLYTPLKRLTAWAAIPGSMVGAIPPALGWAVAGGSVFDPAILMVAAFFFIWQVPHFWLLLMWFGEDYGRSGLPNMLHVMAFRRLARLTYAGVVLTALSASAGIMLAGTVEAAWALTALFLAAGWLVWCARGLWNAAGASDRVVKRSFIAINIYCLGVIVMLAASGLMG